MSRILPLLLLTACGCSLVQPSSSDLSTTTLEASHDVATYQQIAAARRGNNVVLQVEGDEQTFRVLPLPNTGHPVFLSDLLDQTGLTNTFGRMAVDVYRNSADTVDGIKMGVDFHPDTGEMMPTSDYALRPGDRIAVAQDKAPLGRGMLNKLIGL